MIVAARLEKLMSKPQILGLYLNGIYLGRGAYGIEMAAQSYFGKPVGQLTLPEAALLAGMPKGPNFYSPDRYPERARERRGYVLARLKEEGAITDAELAKANAADFGLKPLETARRDSGFYLVDYLGREARTVAGLDSLTASSFTVKTTINAPLQRAVESALQDGLATYERGTGRQTFTGPEMNIADSVARIEAAAPAPEASPQAAPTVTGAKPEKTPAAKSPKGAKAAPALIAGKPAWQRALESARPVLYDVHWPLAVVLEPGRGAVKVGLDDGRIATLDPGIAKGKLQRYDVVRVKLSEGRGAPRAQIRVRPTVQGAALVLENKTGRILAMAGGFSYPVSQLNRVTQAVRQPGSTLKPLTYLAALQAGLQPNTLVLDSPVTLPPIGGTGDSWSPKNYEGGGSGPTTLRRGLEFSKNLVTARLLQGGIAPKAPASLKKVCDIALEAQIYAECEPYYPFVLGAQPVRMLDLAGFYAAVANEGARPSPYTLESVEKGGKAVFTHPQREPIRIGSADRIAFYQLKTMLQGVTQHGTAAALAGLSSSVAGKTGTSENENDAWFAGFSNEITVVVWVGYDNADGTRRTLGRGQTGGHVSVPIAGTIFKAAWANGIPRTPLRGPSPEARPFIADIAIDPRSGTPGAGSFVEHFRTAGNGQMADTRYRLVPREDLYAMRPDAQDGDLAGADDGANVAGDYYGNMTGEGGSSDPFDPFAERPAQRSRRAGADPYGYGGGADDPYRPWPGQTNRSPFGDDDAPRRPRRRDPDYLFGDGPSY
jgi:membrane carboxypeptidase/penicillin-binding protein